jgi:hypothetical protein
VVVLGIVAPQLCGLLGVIFDTVRTVVRRGFVKEVGAEESRFHDGEPNAEPSHLIRQRLREALDRKLAATVK